MVGHLRIERGQNGIAERLQNVANRSQTETEQLTASRAHKQVARRPIVKSLPAQTANVLAFVLFLNGKVVPDRDPAESTLDEQPIRMRTD